MEKFSLSSKLRDMNIGLRELRLSKQIPAVVYGHKFASTNITIDTSEFTKLFRKCGMTKIVDLMLDGKHQNVLVHELQRHPVTDAVLHIDFFVVSSTEKIHLQIPLILSGVSQAQKSGALIEMNMHSLEVKVLPKDLVDTITVDISRLEKTGDVVHVRDIEIDRTKFEILSPEGGAVVSAHAPKRQDVTEEASTVAPGAVPTVQDEKKTESAQ